MDRFQALRVFSQVVEAGSFSGAAEKLGLSTTAASRHVAELEAHLQTRLLNRTTRRVSLTESGRTFYERAVQLLADLAEAEQEASRASVVPRGTVRLTTSINFGARHVAPAIAAFLAAHPGVRFDVSLSDRIVDLVEEGFDLAVRIGAGGSDNVVARKLGETRLGPRGARRAAAAAGVGVVWWGGSFFLPGPRSARRQAGAVAAGLRVCAAADLRGVPEPQAPFGESAPVRRVPARALRRRAGLERGLRLVLASLLLQAALCQAADPEGVLAPDQPSVVAGQSFEIIVAGEAPLPDEIEVRLRTDIEQRVVVLRARGPAERGRRRYAADMPATMAGNVQIDLVARDSSALQLAVAAPGQAPPGTGRHAPGEYEPPLSENDPMYFIVGEHHGWTARFQLSFKYRLFDLGTGFGREQPWLTGFYLGYTQNSIWDLSSQSKPFRDTSYRPQLFWKWDRADEKTFIDSVRFGLEHESNGGDAANSRSINTVFIRPEWHHSFANRHEMQFMPKFYSYLEKDENPDIAQYRGYADWQLRYDAAGEWVTTLIGCYGTSGKGSFQVDVSKRLRDLRFDTSTWKL